MIRVTQKQKKAYAKSFSSNYNKDTHTEVYLVTTYWILFIPIFQYRKLTHSTLKN